MKNRFFALLCAALLLLLCACTTAPKPEDLLQGSWTRAVTADAAFVESLLGYLEFTPEEIALADPASLYYTEALTFNADKTYSLSDRADEARVNAIAFFDGLIATIYDNLDSLESVYGEGASADFVSLEDFQDFYAYLFELDSYREVLELFADETYEYSAFGEETGTFTAETDTIHFTVSGASESEYVDYLLSGNTLTVTYAEDAISVYTRAA